MPHHKEGKIIEDGDKEAKALVVISVDQQIGHIVLNLSDVIGQLLIQRTVVATVLELILA